MKAKSRKAAWGIVDKLFPTDYMKDERASERAGYSIFKSTLDGCGAWISDMTTRLEVNTEDGQTVTVWIEEESESVCGFKVAPLYTPTPAVVVALTIYGGTLAQNEAEQKVYDELKSGSNYAAFPVLEQYAANAGIKWGSMRVESVTHYDHHTPGNGHYVIQGIICPTVGDPFAFLPICSALLAEQYKEHHEE